MSNLEIYNTVCAPRFETLEGNQKDVAEDVHMIREKLFNGFSERMDRIESVVVKIDEREENRKRSRSLIIRDVLLSVIGAGGIVSLLIEKVF